jgi:hypothetical protein
MNNTLNHSKHEEKNNSNCHKQQNQNSVTSSAPSTWKPQIQDNTCWKFVYFNKTRISNFGWMVRKGSC